MARTKRPSKPAKRTGKLPSFPRFQKLPKEIQQMIFTEALCKPSVHIVSVTHDRDRKLAPHASWTLRINPQDVRRDPSGFRISNEISAVNEDGAAAVRLAATTEGSSKKNPGESQTTLSRLPFKSLKNCFDAAEDLVFFDIRRSFDYFSNARQFLNGDRNNFDPDAVAADYPNVQKVALWYFEDNRRVAASDPTPDNFRCIMEGWDRPHKCKTSWSMCPEEVSGLLECFPSLREFYLIFWPAVSGDEDKLSKPRIDNYIRNYYTLPSSSPLRRSLAVFHDAGHSYIEMHPSLMWEDQALKEKEKATNAENYEKFRDRVKKPPLADHSSVVRKHATVTALLRELKAQFWLPDTKPGLTPAERDAAAAMFRMSREDREKLVCKLLIRVPDEQKKGWEGEMREMALEKLLGGNRVE